MSGSAAVCCGSRFTLLDGAPAPWPVPSMAVCARDATSFNIVGSAHKNNLSGPARSTSVKGDLVKLNKTSHGFRDLGGSVRHSSQIIDLVQRSDMTSVKVT